MKGSGKERNAEEGKGKGPPPCIHFNSASGCKHGDKCRFAHVTVNNAAAKDRSANKNRDNIAKRSAGDDSKISGAASDPGKKNVSSEKKICPFFIKGNCKNGSKCKDLHQSKSNNGKSHEPRPSSQSAPANQGARTASQEILNFWKRVCSTNALEGKSKLSMYDSSELPLWIGCWQAAASGVASPIPNGYALLLQVYLNAPNVDKLHPPAISVMKVIGSLVNQLLNKHSSSNSKKDNTARGKNQAQGDTDALLRTLSSILDVVRDRLKTPESMQTISDPQVVIREMDDLSRVFPQIIMSCEIEMEKRNVLFARLTDFIDYRKAAEVYCASHANSNNIGGIEDFNTNESGDEAGPSWLQWRDRPTVGWLMDESWHVVPELSNTYENETQYTETLLRVWTLLTFYWGSGAVWPRCMHRQGGGPGAGGGAGAGEEKVCGEPLLHPCSGQHTPCSSRIRTTAGVVSCSRPAKWRCHRHSPGHFAICTSCLSQQQHKLAGDPGREASTDIYDAVVDREHTRREGSVFCLSALRSRKPPTIAPNWRTSYRLQNSALVAVVKLSVSGEALERMHSIQWAEIVPYSSNPEHHEDASRSQGRIAVRLLTRGDCSTLLSESDTPLEPGTRVALIDLRVFVPEVISVLSTFADAQFPLHLKQIPFVGRLIGTSESLPPIVGNANTTILAYVYTAIVRSEIECIKMLPQSSKEEVASKICELPAVKSLYGTQLEAFANSLYSSVHCIQGPPGTGKSYVGVCQVLALLIIRKAVRANGKSVGPILMLSYKNHALDEFLCDVVKFNSKLKPGDLIRSGKPENPLLQAFAERNSPDELKYQKELSDRIANQRLVRRVAKEWLESARSLHAAFDEPDLYCSLVRSLCTAVSLIVRLSHQKQCDSSRPSEIAATAYTVLVGMNVVCNLTAERCLNALQVFISQAEHWLQQSELSEAYKYIQQHNDDKSVGDPRVVHWIDSWLQGLIPPPRCTAEDDKSIRCLKVACSHSSYCREVHGCLSGAVLCQNKRKEGGFSYCPDHSCAADATCKLERFGACQYCIDHACPSCVSSKRSVVKAKVGLYACADHKCRIPTCTKLKLDPHDYCEIHCCTECLRTGSVLNIPRFSATDTLCKIHKCAVKNCHSMRNSLRSKYCFDHKCTECDGVIDATVPTAKLCASHRCSHYSGVCGKKTVHFGGSFSDFCADHTCRVCVDMKADVLLPATDRPPRNCCFQHPLCQGQNDKGVLCSSLALSNSQYCAKHKVVNVVATEVNQSASKIQLKVDGRCCGVTKKGQRCKHTDKSEQSQKDGVCFFCSDHVTQKPLENEAKVEAGVGVAENNRNVEAGYAVIEATDIQETNTLSGKTDGETFAASDVAEAIDSDDEVESHGEGPAEKGDGNASDGESGFDSAQDAEDDLAFDIADAVDAAIAEEVENDHLKAAPPVQLEREADEDDDLLTAIALSRSNDTTVFHVVQCSAVTSTGRHCVVSTLRARAAGNHQKWCCALHSEVRQVVVASAAAPLRAVSNSGATAASSAASTAPKDNKKKTNTIEPRATAIAVPVAEAHYDIVNFDNIEIVDAAVGIDPDELDVEAGGINGANYGDLDEQQNDDQLRIKEIGAAHDDSDDDDDGIAEEESDDDDVLQHEPYSEARALEIAGSWNWSMTVEERFQAAIDLLRCSSFVANQLRATADEHVMAARREKAQASAAALKSAKVVGATVVGASRRLEAIRAAEPFAVIVEEACEVMEPTLISVLAVKSLYKLELVGDHRQLPAFVQQCWYNLESSVPSIKTSLFERLISGTVARRAANKKQQHVAEQVPCTVLDEQRRMRSSIADITRPDYQDIVTIVDHPQTAKQLIGDALIRGEEKNRGASKAISDLQLHRSVWSGLGRHVPGMRSNIFFWNLKDHKESRPQAGLSACNEMEANAIAGLTKYLLLCGVPTSSISIITPYKGQKNLLIKTLRKENCIASFSRDGKPPPAHSSIIVSTVDRYQGDENDIVILSLVRSRPGNRFVALLNRFIVAVSRARLGFYIVGSVDAVIKGQHGDGPKHWIRFVEQLKNAPEISSERNGFQSPRVASELPVCCPRHAGAYCAVSTPQEFPVPTNWNKFCREECKQKIACGHTCSVGCHSPTTEKHTVKCERLVPRPCDKHEDVELHCYEVDRQEGESVYEALEYFDCKIPMMHRRQECGHEVRVECILDTHLIDGTMELKPCEIKVNDYHYPSCEHIIKAPKCHESRKYMTSTPQCLVKVVRERPCKCRLEMTCDEKNAELKRPVICKIPKNVRRPRCTHTVSLLCHKNTELLQLWERKGISSAAPDDGTTPNLTPQIMVEFGEEYGPSETALLGLSCLSTCNQVVQYKASCGHKRRDVPCDAAFRYASGETEELRCDSMVRIKCPVCSNCDLTVPCWAANRIAEYKEWSKIQLLIGNNLSANELAVDLAELDLPTELQQLLNNKCVETITIVRSCNPLHRVTVPCHRFLQLLLKKKTLDNCSVVVNRELHCRHLIPVPCHTRNDLRAPRCKSENDKEYMYPCHEHWETPKYCVMYQDLVAQRDNAQCPFEVECVLYRCGHRVKTTCCKKVAVTDRTVGSRLTKEIQKNGARSQHVGLIEHSVAYCASPKEAPSCNSAVAFRRPCGHILYDVKCCDAFEWAEDFQKAPRCTDLIDFRSPICGHEIKVQCWVKDAVANWSPWKDRKVPTVEIESFLNEYGEEVECIAVSGHNGKIAALPASITLDLIRCSHPATRVRACGHSDLSACTDVYCHDGGKCTVLCVTVCEQPLCKVERRFPCHEYSAQRLTGTVISCSNKIQTLCTVCGVNDVKVECFKQNNAECKKDVSVDLPCGHIVSWRCGSSNDPRKEAAFLCRGCEIPKWNEYLKADVTTLVASFFALANATLTKAIPDVYAIESRHQIVTADLSMHVESRNRILQLQKLHLMNDLSTPMLPVPHRFASEEDFVESYDLVYKTLDKIPNAKNQDISSDKFHDLVRQAFNQRVDSPYGLGVRAHLFIPENLKMVEKSVTGVLTVCVGIAYRRGVVAGVKPFSNSKDQKKRNLDANKVSNAYINSGHSCVTIDVPVDKQPEPRKDCIYWIPGAVVPLGILELRPSEECCICTDRFSKHEGCFCPSGHFVCYESCLPAYVKSASEADAIQSYMNQEGQLLCPQPKCKVPYEMHLISDKDVFSEMMKLTVNRKVNKGVQEQLEILEAQRRAEEERIQKIKDNDERDAHIARRTIVNDILTLSCPRCKAAFIGFDGCFALTCIKGTCGAGFCAWCLQDCGADAHRHVANCPENQAGGSVWSTQEQFNEHHRNRRKVLVEGELRKHSEAVQKIILRIMEKDLRDLKIDVRIAIGNERNDPEVRRGFFGLW